MSRVKGFDLVTIGVVSLVGIYTGARFFEPLVVGQLEKDGHLRKDIEVPKYDSEGNLLIPEQNIQSNAQFPQSSFQSPPDIPKR
ncbi:Protein ECM19 [Nakaseomyces bracarensis]|uniref:Protein ECM19 n=1 Tax=Nakaseomyces bracarensis TaxID=273131 RepID=A0ABR4NWZ4_9SACH